MTHRLNTNYAKNYCNWTLIVKVIIENVVTCFLGTQCSIAVELTCIELLYNYIPVNICNLKRPINRYEKRTRLF